MEKAEKQSIQPNNPGEIQNRSMIPFPCLVNRVRLKCFLIAPVELNTPAVPIATATGLAVALALAFQLIVPFPLNVTFDPYVTFVLVVAFSPSLYLYTLIALAPPHS